MSLLFAGCASVTTLQGARTLPPGETTYDFGGTVASDLGRDSFARGVNFGAGFQAGARHGFTDGIDGGYRVTLLGFKTDAKIRLLDEDEYAVAIAPGLGLEKTYAFYGLDVYLPVIAQYQWDAKTDVYVSPKAIGRVSLGGTGSDIGAGLSLGFARRVSQTVAILPEVTLMWPSLGGSDYCGLQVGPSSGSCLRPGWPVVVLAVGFEMRR